MYMYKSLSLSIYMYTQTYTHTQIHTHASGAPRASASSWPPPPGSGRTPALYSIANHLIISVSIGSNNISNITISIIINNIISSRSIIVDCIITNTSMYQYYHYHY